MNLSVSDEWLFCFVSFDRKLGGMKNGIRRLVVRSADAVLLSEPVLASDRFGLLGLIGRRVHQRAGGGEEFAGLEEGLEAGEDHGPSAEELVVGALAKLVVGDFEEARIGHGLDFPCDTSGALLLDLFCPEGAEALDEAARWVYFEVFAFE